MFYHGRPKRVGRDEEELRTECKVRLGIVGSRYYKHYRSFKQVIDRFQNTHKVNLVISGGANGADHLAEMWADENRIETKIYYPDFSKGNRGYAIRNQQIVDLCTHLIAFPSRKGKGTQMTIQMARKLGKHLEVIYID